MRLGKKKRILKKYGITINAADADIKRIKFRRKLFRLKNKDITFDGKGQEFNLIDPKKPLITKNNPFIKAIGINFKIRSYNAKENKNVPTIPINIDQNAYWRETKKIKKEGLIIDPKKT